MLFRRTAVTQRSAAGPLRAGHGAGGLQNRGVTRGAMLAGISACTLLAPFTTAAADEDDTPRIPALDKLQFPTFGDGVPLTYARPTDRPRAEAVRGLIKSTADFYSSKLDVRPPFALGVLGPDDWKAAFGSEKEFYPYPVPYSIWNGRVCAVVPAKIDAIAASYMIPPRDRLSDEGRAQLDALHMDDTTLATRFYDFISTHELGHLYAHAANVRVHIHWLNELLATYMATGYAYEHDPQLFDVVRKLSVLRANIESHPHHSLEDFERLYFGVGPVNYDWYQVQFVEQAAKVYPTQGFAFVLALREAFRDVSRGATLSVDESLVRVEAIAPGFKAWAATVFA